MQKTLLLLILITYTPLIASWIGANVLLYKYMALPLNPVVAIALASLTVMTRSIVFNANTVASGS